MVHIAAAGLAAGIRVEQMAELQIAYPTYASVIGLAARRVLRQFGQVPVAPEWHSLEKRLPALSGGAEWELRS